MEYLKIPIKTPIEAKTSLVMWHGTSSINLQSILKHGLLYSDKNKAVYDTNKFGSVTLEKGIYLSSSIGEALSYAEESAKKYRRNPIMIACYTVFRRKKTH